MIEKERAPLRIRESIRVCVSSRCNSRLSRLGRASGRCIGDTTSIDIDDVDPVTANAHARERASERAADEYRAGTRTRTYTHIARARGYMDEEARARIQHTALVTRRCCGRERLPAVDVFTLVFAQSPRPCEVRLRLGWLFSCARVFSDVSFFFLFPRGYLPGGVLNSIANNSRDIV